MIKGIGLREQKVNIDKDAFQFLHKEMLKTFAVNLAGDTLFDAEKYGEISRVSFSKNGMPEDIILTLKKEIKGRIANIEMSVKNSTKEEITAALIEHNKLS